MESGRSGRNSTGFSGIGRDFDRDKNITILSRILHWNGPFRPERNGINKPAIKCMAMPATLRALNNLLNSKKVAAAMAVRLLLALMVFVFCLAEVSSDLKIDTGALHGGQLVVRAGNRRLMQDIDCGGLCNQRCSLHSRPNVCTRACGTCCVRCKCVPPGTSGNREVCGTCYTDMTTHGNKTKCP